jgi:hypothetical protein
MHAKQRTIKTVRGLNSDTLSKGKNFIFERGAVWFFEQNEDTCCTMGSYVSVFGLVDCAIPWAEEIVGWNPEVLRDGQPIRVSTTVPTIKLTI